MELICVGSEMFPNIGWYITHSLSDIELICIYELSARHYQDSGLSRCPCLHWCIFHLT